VRCDNCREEIREAVGTWDKWQALWVTVAILETEEAITPATAERMRDDLLWLKAPIFAYEERDRDEEAAEETEAGKTRVVTAPAELIEAGQRATRKAAEATA